MKATGKQNPVRSNDGAYYKRKKESVQIVMCRKSFFFRKVEGFPENADGWPT